MNLVFLHGPPAAGKFTVAMELAALTGFELYHNHLVVDEVLQEHAFGTPGFVGGRDRRWREYFGRYPGAGRANIIFTFNPENSVPQAFIDWLFAEMPRRRVPLLSVGLTASEELIEGRITSKQRRLFKKLTDVSLYRQLRDRGVFATPFVPRTDLELNTGLLAPTEAAGRIVRHFHLG